MYALLVQAVVDSSLRFHYMSCRCTGSTHDAVAFDSSGLAARLLRGDMKPGYWIAGDPAYVPVNGLLTPWPRSELAKEDGIYIDGFKFYHSSHPIHLEQAFGVLLQRWGILWKPLRFQVDSAIVIVSVTMRLHNFWIDEEGNRCTSQGSN